MARSKHSEQRQWVVRYYADTRLGVDNWSSQGYAKELINAKRSAVVHLITEHWSYARIYSRHSPIAVCVLKRTAHGISIF